MDSEQSKRALEVLSGALQRDPEERQMFVEAECSKDPAVRAEVDRLLALSEEGKEIGFLDGELEINVQSLVTDPLIGRSMGPYRILSVLGQGGMGVVYKAIQTPLGREVALKVLPSALAALRSDAVDRFRREASAASKLHHHNIIPVYDFGTSHGAYYYAMELVSGQSLNVLIKRLGAQGVTALSPTRLAELLSTGTPGAGEVLSADGDGDAPADDPGSVPGSGSTAHGRVYFEQVACWMADVAEALHYAHGNGVVHRDIKPGNLILTSDGRILLADFGLAKVADTESVTVPGSLIGTWRYMSPEQALAKRMPIDHRTDIYSLGATMYELLVFQPAVKGRDEKEIITQIITKEPTHPRRIIASVPRELETICLKTLEKDASARYETARAMADDLRRFLQGFPIVAKRPGPALRAVKFIKRHKAPFVAAIAGVLLVAATTFLIYERSRRAEAEIMRLNAHVRTFVYDRQWTRARAKLNEALAIKPDHVGTLLTMAWMGLTRHQLDESADRFLREADQACQRAIQIEPTSFTAWNYQGAVHKMLGRYREAIDAYKQATELDPSESASFTNLGTVHALKGDLALAKQYLTRGATLAGEGEGEDKYHAQAWRNLAALELFLGEPQAANHLQRALHWNGSDVASRTLQARIWLGLEGHIDVSRAVETAVAVGTASDTQFGITAMRPLAKRLRALAHLRLREPEQATLHARAAIDLGDGPTINHLIMAIAEATRGNPVAARGHLDKGQETWPEDLVGQAAFRATAKNGILWFESRRELDQLRREAEKVIGSDSPP